MSILLVSLITVFLGILWCSLFEWVLHRYIMHRPVHFMGINLTYPFARHALTHHKAFDGEKRYHAQDGQNKSLIRMAWWAGPVLVLSMEIPFVSFGVLFFLFSSMSFAIWLLPIIGGICATLYFVAYEYFHWLMHDPKNRILERSRIFHFINGHHVLHHKFDDNNLNVVFPFADWLLGTLLLRSDTSFNQPQGASVPNVQPLNIE
jgi:hypothetical protein